LLQSFTGFAVRQNFKKLIYLGQFVEFEKYFTCQFKTEEHAGGMPRHARQELSSGLKETLKPRGFSGEKSTT
jgi:hypothetical protein